MGFSDGDKERKWAIWNENVPFQGIITLKASYLSTLSPGEYTLTATFSIYGNIIESEPVTFTVA